MPSAVAARSGRERSAHKSIAPKSVHKSEAPKNNKSEADKKKDADKVAKTCDLVFVQPQEVMFTGPFSDWIYTFVTLINPSKRVRCVYKFKSNCKRNFTVRPVYGYIDKGGAAAIKVTCRPLQPDWLSSKHRLTVIVATLPNVKGTPQDDAEAVWAKGKPWTPTYSKTTIVPVKYRRDDGSEIGGSAGEGKAATRAPSVLHPGEKTEEGAQCPSTTGGECTCGQHVFEPSAEAPQEECTCGADHSLVANEDFAALSQSTCGSHGTDAAKAIAGDEPTCTCAHEGDVVTAAAVAAIRANCDSHKDGGAPDGVCTCGQLASQQMALTAAQAAQATAACGCHGTDEAKGLAGPDCECTCGQVGTQPSAATIEAVSANCASHGVVAAKNGKQPGAVCTCLAHSTSNGKATAAHAAASRASCCCHGTAVAKRIAPLGATCTCCSEGSVPSAATVAAARANCGCHGEPAAKAAAGPNPKCSCIPPPPKHAQSCKKSPEEAPPPPKPKAILKTSVMTKPSAQLASKMSPLAASVYMSNQPGRSTYAPLGVAAEVRKPSTSKAHEDDDEYTTSEQFMAGAGAMKLKGGNHMASLYVAPKMSKKKGKKL